MSAFIVSNETINRVVHLLDVDPYNGQQWGHLVAPEADERGQQLWQLNADAVAFRYQQPAESPGAYRWSPRHYTPFELLKAAHCWLYQCNEGEQFTGSLLYAEVEKRAEQLSNSIVSRLPQYDAVDWDARHNARCQGQES